VKNIPKQEKVFKNLFTKGVLCVIIIPTKELWRSV